MSWELVRQVRELEAGHVAKVLLYALASRAGKDDSCYPSIATLARNSRHIFENVGSTRKEMMLLDNSFHMVTADLERDRVAHAMARFCQSLADKPGPGLQAHANAG